MLIETANPRIKIGLTATLIPVWQPNILLSDSFI
jgi:hypothetical protein